MELIKCVSKARVSPSGRPGDLVTVPPNREFQGRGAHATFGTSWLHFSLLFQAAVKEVASRSLVSSACDVVSAAYASTKGSQPCLRSVCDAAEKGVQCVTEATASCVLATLEPHGKSLGRAGPAWEGLPARAHP